VSSLEQQLRSRIVRIRCDVSARSVAQARCLRYLVAPTALHIWLVRLLGLLALYNDRATPDAFSRTRYWSESNSVGDKFRQPCPAPEFVGLIREDDDEHEDERFLLIPSDQDA
jgi:hypothetical protein